MGLYEYTFYNVIKRNARIQRDHVSWVCGEERITNQQFLQKIDRVSRGLSNLGVKKGDRIAVLAQNSIDYFYIYGAAAKLGAVMLPISWRLKPEEIEYIVADGRPKVIFMGREYQELAHSYISNFTFVEKMYMIGPGAPSLTSFNELADNDGCGAEVDKKSDDPYVIIYTAAVSGKPQGAILSYNNLIIASLQCVCAWNITKMDSHLCMVPLFHLAGLGTCLSVMLAGGKNVFLPKFSVDSALKHIQDDKISLFFEFPPMLATLLDENMKLKYDLSSLRIVVGLDIPETIKRFEDETRGTFWSAFGQSETSGFVTLSPYFERVGSAGLPVCMAEVSIMDESGNLVNAGTPGEIVVRGPMVFKGYWNLSRVTQHTFRDGWHHTGDTGRFDENGYLWYEGRMKNKDLIKPGGENVYPAEVEQAICGHPLVKEVSVIGVPDQQWGEAIMAVCVLKQGASLDGHELIEFVASRIARFKKPKHVVFVSELPKTKDGVIDRAKVKEQYSIDESSVRSFGQG